MTSTTTSNISISGLLRSTKTKGFTTQGALHELIDNSIDAEATIIDIKFDSNTNTLVISDNGKGMDKSQADKAYCIHNDKPASDKIGLFGVGKTVAEGVLSDLQSTTMTITKSETGRLLEISADWPASILTGTWNPVSHGASADIGLPLWKKQAVNLSHGTVVSIQMTNDAFKSFTSEIQKVIGEICYTYQDVVNSVRINVSIDGVQQEMNYSDGLGWDLVDDEKRNMTRIEVWTKEGSETRIFHSEGSEMVRFNRNAKTSTGTPKDALTASRLKDYVSSSEQGYVCKANFQLRSVYNPIWNPELVQTLDSDEPRPDFTRGYLSFRRGNRHLKRLDAEVPNSGDFERRRVLGSARHSLDYTYTADEFLRTEGNKSNVTKDNVDKDLMWTVRALARKWSTVYYDHHVVTSNSSNSVENEHSVPRNVVKLFKTNYANEAWRNAYNEFLAAHPLDA